MGEDGEFMRKCELLSVSPVKINYTSYCYRLRKGSATHNPEKERIVVEDAFSVLKNILYHISSNKVAPAEWKTYRIITIAKSIPANAIKSQLWNRNVIKSFQTMIKDYKKIGFDLQQDRTIRLATMMPSIYQLITRIKSK